MQLLDSIHISRGTTADYLDSDPAITHNSGAASGLKEEGDVYVQYETAETGAN